VSQDVRIGIISDSLLQQHLLQSVITDTGYQVAVNSHPDKLNKAIFHSETISMWVVDIINEDYNSEFLDSLFEHAEAPVFIGEGVSPDRNSEEYSGWCRRLLGKLEEISPPEIRSFERPEVDLSIINTGPPVVETIALPEHLGNIPKASVNQLWVLASSLGGPEAVKEFLDRLPAGIPASFLYAQHIDESFIDNLVTSIGRHTELEMAMLKQDDHIQNSRVLVVPVENEVMFRTDLKVDVVNTGWSGPYGPSIDHLLKNVVETWGKKVNLIVFSGMGSDGTLGALKVCEAGGKIWSQSSESAIQPSMPDSVAEADCVSFRGSPTELADRLVAQLDNNILENMAFLS